MTFGMKWYLSVPGYFSSLMLKGSIFGSYKEPERGLAVSLESK